MSICTYQKIWEETLDRISVSDSLCIIFSFICSLIVLWFENTNNMQEAVDGPF